MNAPYFGYILGKEKITELFVQKYILKQARVTFAVFLKKRINSNIHTMIADPYLLGESHAYLYFPTAVFGLH